MIVFAPQSLFVDAFINGTYCTFDLSTLLPPIGNIEVEKQNSEKYDITNDIFFADFLNSNRNNLSCISYFIKFSGTPLIQSHLSKKILSFYNDKAIFLPHPKNVKDIEQIFLQDLYKIAVRINNSEGKYVVPEWSRSYFLPNERDNLEKQNDLKKQIESYQNSLIDLQRIQNVFNEHKMLIMASGGLLENEVKKIFEGLGVNILEAEPGRDDLILKYNDKIAVVEIKGVTGSAAEKNAAQLEKWVSNYYEQNGVQPKGILIVNAFRDVELDKRGEVFPHQMLDYCKKREHCLISTTQLLGLYYDILGNPAKKDELINSLYSTIGVYNSYKNWKEFISIGG